VGSAHHCRADSRRSLEFAAAPHHAARDPLEDSMPVKLRALLAAATLLPGLTCLTGAARAEEQTTQVRVVTNMGEFVIEVRPDRAPLTAADFLRYVKEGFYTNTLIHRVVPNFVIQGGGHDATTMNLKPTHENIVNESGNGLQNKRGAVGLARSTAPHSGNAEFYINLVDNPDLDPVPTRWGYAVFGRVVQGMDVIDKIGETPTGAVGPFKQDAPLKPIIIQSITIVAPGAAPPPAATPVNPSEPQKILSPK
jgi:peptidyl-prolyl cis-trans isomerase A (cyclophilin A)